MIWLRVDTNKMGLLFTELIQLAAVFLRYASFLRNHLHVGLAAVTRRTRAVHSCTGHHKVSISKRLQKTFHVGVKIDSGPQSARGRVA